MDATERSLRGSSTRDRDDTSVIGNAAAWLVDLCRRKAWAVVLVSMAIVGSSAFLAATCLGFDTDTNQLIDPTLAWRQREIAFNEQFPQNTNLLVIVVDGTTPELAESATAQLADALTAETGLFRTVRRPDGGAFFARNGLLFLPEAEVQAFADHVIEAQPFIGGLAADPSLRGLFDTLSVALEGVVRGEARPEDLAPALTRVGDAIRANLVPDEKLHRLSWQSLLSSRQPLPRELRHFLLVQPVLDFGALEPGAKASKFARAAAERLQLTTANGVTIRLTGPVALNDEQFQKVGKGIGLSTCVSLVLVLLLLLVALRSLRMTAAIMATLFVGLIVTAGFAAVAVGALNLISVAFAVLFIGIAVDFGIQICTGYRADRYATGDLAAALRATARRVGPAVVLAAIATSTGFYAFLPTAYAGISELGLIAGTGMIVAAAFNLTLLPALLTLFRVGPEKEAVGWTALAPLDRFLLERRRLVLTAAAVAALGSIALLPRLEFDFNPLNLMDARSESVSTMLELMRDPVTTPNTIEVLAPSVDAAATLAARLSALPEVAQAITLASYVPPEQEPKLALIGDAAMLLGPTLDLPAPKAPPDDAATREAIERCVGKLREVAATGVTGELAALLTTLAAADQATLRRVEGALVGGLTATLGQLRMALQAGPVTLADLPHDVRESWVAPDGTARVSAFPRGDANDNAVLRRFVTAVREIAPDATGTPVSIQEASATIVGAFQTAAALAIVGIAVLLAVALRRMRDVVLALAPLVLAGLLTLATTIVFGLKLNFANIIALPLLLGVGVAFDIYYVVNWRAGLGGPLQSSTTRAVVFSALTTASAFGALWLSPHPGTAGMGELLTIELAWTLVCVLLVMPAMLGEPRKPAGFAHGA